MIVVVVMIMGLLRCGIRGSQLEIGDMICLKKGLGVPPPNIRREPTYVGWWGTGL